MNVTYIMICFVHKTMQLLFVFLIVSFCLYRETFVERQCYSNEKSLKDFVSEERHNLAYTPMSS
jgi:hypothetical protein